MRGRNPKYRVVEVSITVFGRTKRGYQVVDRQGNALSDALEDRELAEAQIRELRYFERSSEEDLNSIANEVRNKDCRLEEQD